MKRIHYLSLTLVVALLIFFKLRSCDRHIDRDTSSTILRPGVIEKIIVHPDTHKIIIVKPEGQETLYLPDRPSSIEINEKGSATVTSKQYGTEFKFFGGGQYSKEFRLAAGLDFFYYKKLDLGVGIAGRIGNYSPVLFGKLSYNLWSNLQAGVTYDTGNRAGVSLTVRF